MKIVNDKWIFFKIKWIKKSMMLKKIRILVDNYVWMLVRSDGFCIIIDPGLSEPIIQEMEKKKWFPVAILLTHNHIDHTGGVKKIIDHFPKITVFGPSETKECGVNKIIGEGDKIIILNNIFCVFFTPGHTLGHVSYYSRPYLFCGDTLFSGGCGRVYKEKYLEMYKSIKMISSFPDSTILCCTHEYTLSNLNFSIFYFPNDQIIRLYFERIKNIINLGRSSLPSYVLFEKRINIFLRMHEKVVKRSLGLEDFTDFEVFVKLRLKKDFWS